MDEIMIGIQKEHSDYFEDKCIREYYQYAHAAPVKPFTLIFDLSVRKDILKQMQQAEDGLWKERRRSNQQ
jgi:hypothetical protein